MLKQSMLNLVKAGRAFVVQIDNGDIFIEYEDKSYNFNACDFNSFDLKVLNKALKGELVINE